MIKVDTILLSVALVGLAGCGAGTAAQQAGSSRSSPETTDRKGGQGAQAGRRSAAQDRFIETLRSNIQRATPSRREKLYSNVAGQTVIISVLPHGSLVKKGQVVCELDSAALKDSLIIQRITTTRAKAAREQSRMEREVAEMAVIEYEQGLYPLQLLEIEGAIKIAEGELNIVETRLDLERKAGPHNKNAIGAAELAVKKARFALEVAQTKRKVLTDYTKPRKIKGLRTAVENARTGELAKSAILQLEVTKERKLESQISQCTVIAPIGGTVVYTGYGLEEGSLVRERQPLFEIVSPPEVKAESP